MQKCLCWLLIVCCANLCINRLAVGDDRKVSPETTTKSGSKSGSVEIREFEVRVDDRPAGTHRLTIQSDGDEHRVAFQTDVKMDFIVYAYVFKFRGTEIWHGDKLDFTDIHCEDGGKKRTFSLKTDGAVQQIAFNGKPIPGAAPGVMTTAYWRLPPAELTAKRLSIIDVDTGATRDAKINVVGRDKVTSSGRTVACQHVKIDGPSPAELWFDDQNRLVRQKSVEVGHAMELRLKQIRIAKDEK